MRSNACAGSGRPCIELTRVRTIGIDTKTDLTPVTDADRRSNSTRQTLGCDRPGDGVLGVRSSADQRPSPDGDRRPKQFKNFVRGAPVWASLIALLKMASRRSVVSAPCCNGGGGAARAGARSHPSMVRVHTGCRFLLWQSCIRRVCRFPTVRGAANYVNASSG